jgi:hypothetical protein
MDPTLLLNALSAGAAIAGVDGEKMIAPVVFDDKDNDPVTLEKFCDDHWGFVRLEVTDQLVTGRFYQVPRPQEPFSKGNQLLDYFEFDRKARAEHAEPLTRMCSVFAGDPFLLPQGEGV